MNTYRIALSIAGPDGRIEVAETAAKAKYQAYLHYIDPCPDLSFRGFLRMVESCKKIGSFKARDLFGNKETFDRIKVSRQIPFAYQAMKIEVAGKMGTITGANDCMNLDVVMDGDCYSHNCHPWWETRYFDHDGNVVADYRMGGDKNEQS